MIKIGTQNVTSEYIVINNTRYKLLKEVINGNVVYEAIPRLSPPTIELEE